MKVKQTLEPKPEQLEGIKPIEIWRRAYEEGFDDGFESGFNEGNEQGYRDGMDDAELVQINMAKPPSPKERFRQFKTYGWVK